MSAVLFAFACGIEEWSKFLCSGGTRTVTTESPLLNVSFAVDHSRFRALWASSASYKVQVSHVQ